MLLNDHMSTWHIGVNLQSNKIRELYLEVYNICVVHLPVT